VPVFKADLVAKVGLELLFDTHVVPLAAGRACQIGIFDYLNGGIGRAIEMRRGEIPC
jgi:uncharacterized protein YcsI (UPF0317 family)